MSHYNPHIRGVPAQTIPMLIVTAPTAIVTGARFTTPL